VTLSRLAHYIKYSTRLNISNLFLCYCCLLLEQVLDECATDVSKTLAVMSAEEKLTPFTSNHDLLVAVSMHVTAIATCFTPTTNIADGMYCINTLFMH
jgi:phosphohistidine swiveling domain-containing protein